MKDPYWLLLAALLAAPSRLPAQERGADEIARRMRDVARRQEIAARARSANPKLAPVDLSAQFPDPPSRDQSAVGSCSAFGVVALLEAAYDRQYGSHLKLSEADLYINSVLVPALDDPNNRGAYEGGESLLVLDFALAHGVAMNQSYDQFVGRYVPYRDNMAADVSFVDKLAQQKAPWYVRIFEGLLYQDPRKAYIASSWAPETKASVRDFLQKDEQALAPERAKVKEAVANFRSQLMSNDGLECAAAASQAKDFLLRNLAAQRPVLVSMDLGKMPAWGTQHEASPSMHAFVIIGSKPQPDGTLRFSTRNSWGGKNPGVYEDELCRIRKAAALIVPNDL